MISSLIRTKIFGALIAAGLSPLRRFIMLANIKISVGDRYSLLTYDTEYCQVELHDIEILGFRNAGFDGHPLIDIKFKKMLSRNYNDNHTRTMTDISAGFYLDSICEYTRLVK
jgi:hypothetical protein